MSRAGAKAERMGKWDSILPTMLKLLQRNQLGGILGCGKYSIVNNLQNIV